VKKLQTLSLIDVTHIMDKFKNKYRISSHRKPNWDYSADALYFLTIVTQNKECNLGKIVNVVDGAYLQLSDFGRIVEREWFKSFEIRDELILHQFVIMPNHLHAIVEIFNKNRNEMGVSTPVETYGRSIAETHGRSIAETHGRSIAETHGRVSLHGRSIPVDTHGHVYLRGYDSTHIPTESITNEIISIKRNPPIRLPKSISSFIAGFKSAVNTKIDDFIDENNGNDERPFIKTKYNRNNHFFQPNYHDHIIRNQIEYLAISKYIINNPLNWQKDNFKG
jgi:putative transposase